MRAIDKDGLLLCEIQAKTFEVSVDRTRTSSEIFVRRFMYSRIAGSLDNETILQSNMQPEDILDRVEEQYGKSEYGTVKYTHDEMYWIGYIYRYFSFTYEWSSQQVYKVLKPKELRGLFLPYHTLDPTQAIERILEAKNMLLDDAAEIKRQYEILKKVRGADDATCLYNII